MKCARAVAVVVFAGVALGLLAVRGAGSPGAAPSAVARVLPSHYGLLLTQVGSRGRLHIAWYGRPGRDEAFDAPLAVEGWRGRSKPPYEDAPEVHPGDRATRVRGHAAVLRTLTDEGQAFARELAWRERPDLAVVVIAKLALGKRTLQGVAEGMRIVGRRAWDRLYGQTSAAAQSGHVSPDMRRVRLERGVYEDHRWTFLALIPPGFPLSRDDRRAACFELRYRHRRAHGGDCGPTVNWQRVGGSVFVFGAVPRWVRRLDIGTSVGRGFRLRADTVAIRRGPRVRYFVAPLPAWACAVALTPAKHPNDEGWIAGPTQGHDRRRCAARQASGE